MTQYQSVNVKLPNSQLGKLTLTFPFQSKHTWKIQICHFSCMLLGTSEGQNAIINFRKPLRGLNLQFWNIG